MPRLVDGVDGIRKGDLLLGGAMVLSETPVGKLGKLGKLARAGEGAGEAAADTARVASRGGDEAGQLAKQAADSSSATAAAGGKTTAKLGRAEIVTLLQRAAEKSVALAQRDVEMGRISSVKTVVGTRAHTYFEQEVKALGKQLESSGSRLRLKEEVFRKRGVGGMYGSVGGRRELGTKGLDAELRYVKANGKVVPIMGFDLKTGRGWTPGEMRIIRQHFGQMPIYQISVPTRKK